MPLDTVAHFVAECPAAKQLWQAVARRLGWPALARQRWETVVSGLRPRELQAVMAAEGEEGLEQQAKQQEQQQSHQALWEWTPRSVDHCMGARSHGH